MSDTEGKPPYSEQQEHGDPPKMESGKFYDLHPPAQVLSRTFRRIKCKFRVPKDPRHVDSYVVSGVPDGGTEEEDFVLQFTENGVTVTPASEQAFTKPPSLKLV